MFFQCFTFRNDFQSRLSGERSSRCLKGRLTASFLFCKRFSSDAVSEEKEKDNEAPPEAPVSMRNRLLIAALFISLVGFGYYFAEESKKTSKTFF